MFRSSNVFFTRICSKVLLLLSLLLLALFPFERCLAYSGGSGSCNAGDQAPPPHVSYYGGLSTADLFIKFNDTIVTPDTSIRIASDKATKITVGGFVKGLLIRIDNGGTITPVDSSVLQQLSICTNPAAAVTHRDASLKNDLQVEIIPNIQSGIIQMDITVVNLRFGYYYNRFTIAVGETSPGTVPVPSPGVVPVPQPTPKPINSPSKAPVPVLISSPTQVPVPVTDPTTAPKFIRWIRKLIRWIRKSMR